MAQIVKRPRVIVDLEEHAWFILQDNVEAGLRFAEACDAESLARTVEALLSVPLQN